MAEPITICDQVFHTERDSGGAIEAGNSLRFGHNFDFRINQRITSAEPNDEVRVKGLGLQWFLAHRFRHSVASNG
jgi:hypothetical protein